MLRIHLFFIIFIEPSKPPTPSDMFELEKETEIKKNNLLTTRTKLDKEFNLVFDLKPTGKENGWSSIIHIQNKEKACCAPGTRIPALYFYPRSTSVQVCFALNGNGNICFKSKPLEMNKFSKIMIQQVLKYDNRYRYSIEINDEEVYTLTNTKARVYNDIRIFAGNNYVNPAKAINVKNDS